MRRFIYRSAVVLSILITVGCSTTPKSAEDRATLNVKVEDAIAQARQQDLSLEKFFDTAAGYAVFPTVGRGAIGVGGAYGKGGLHEGGSAIRS